MKQERSHPGLAVVPDKAFADRLKQQIGVDAFACYQCLKCSTGCPVAQAMDLLPHQVIKAVQMGLAEEVLSSRTIWICASCLTCSCRCPQEIDIARLMDGLRQQAYARQKGLGDELTPLFHRTFLDSIRRRGRVYEIGMLLSFKFKAKKLFTDIRLGWQMFRKGKLKLFPSRVKKRMEIKELFNRSKSYTR